MLFLSAEIKFVYPENIFIYLSMKKVSFYLPLSCLDYIYHKFTNFSSAYISACISSGNIWEDVFTLQVYNWKFTVAQVSNSGLVESNSKHNEYVPTGYNKQHAVPLVLSLYLITHYSIYCPWSQATDYKGLQERKEIYQQISPFLSPLPKGQNSSMAHLQ